MNASSAPIVRPSVSSTRTPCGSSPSCIASAGRPFARVGASRIRRLTPPAQAWCEEPHDLRRTRAPRGRAASAARRPRAAARRARPRRRAPRRRRSARSSSRSAAAAGAGESAGSSRSIVPRARWSALFAAATVVSSSSATSGPVQPSTSRRISTARWRPGQRLDRGQEGQLHPLALRVARRGIEHRRGRLLDARVGVRLHRRGPAGAALELVQAGVGGDPVQPRLDRRAALEALERAPGAQQRLLHDVLGVLRRAEHAIAVDLERAAVGLDEPPERALVAGAGGRHERALVGCLDRAHTALDGAGARTHR